MKLLIGAILILLAGTSGCSKVHDPSKKTLDGLETSTQAKPAALEIDRGPVIEMEDGRLTYNGQEMQFGAPVGYWEQTIGSKCRSNGPYSSTCTWDDLGIFVYESFKSENVKSLTIKLQDYGREFGESQPHKRFVGRLIIDGVRVDQNTSVDDFNMRSKAADFRCMSGIRICELSYSVRNRADINANVSEQKTRGPIRSISLSVHDVSE